KVRLESKSQAKLELARGAERIHSRAVAYAERVVAAGVRVVGIAFPLAGCGAVDRAVTSSEQNPVQSIGRQVEIGEVEQVVEANTRLYGHPFKDRVTPLQFQVPRAQPGEVHLIGRSQINGGSNSS